MIGGQDVVLKAHGGPASLDACASIVANYWPDARFEDAATGAKYSRVRDVPFGKMRELLIYANPATEQAWDEDQTEAPENSMIYLIVEPQEITVVADNPEAPEMKSILKSMQEWLWMNLCAPSAKYQLQRRSAA